MHSGFNFQARVGCWFTLPRSRSAFPDSQNRYRDKITVAQCFSLSDFSFSAVRYGCLINPCRTSISVAHFTSPEQSSRAGVRANLQFDIQHSCANHASSGGSLVGLHQSSICFCPCTRLPTAHNGVCGNRGVIPSS